MKQKLKGVSYGGSCTVVALELLNPFVAASTGRYIQVVTRRLADFH